MAVKLTSVCLYCNVAFGQGDHAYCLKRLRRLKLVGDQRDVTRQVFYLAGERYRRVRVQECWCGEPYRWRGSQCRAHTRAWLTAYGGRLRSKQGVHKADEQAA